MPEDIFTARCIETCFPFTVTSVLASKFSNVYHLVSQVLGKKWYNFKQHKEDTYTHTLLSVTSQLNNKDS